MFSVGGKLVFAGGQNVLTRTFYNKGSFPLDAPAMQAKSSQPVNLPSVWPLMKSLSFHLNLIMVHCRCEY